MMLPESQVPPLGREVSVRVSYLDGCGFLWLQLQDLDDEFERLYVDLREGLQLERQDALLVSGSFVAAEHSDGLWHRAQLLSSTEDGVVLVRFVDYGNDQTLPPQSIRSLPPKLTKRPLAFALKCKLRGCPELSHQTLDTYLSTFTPDRAIFYAPDAHAVYPIELSCSKPMSINSMLSNVCAVHPVSLPFDAVLPPIHNSGFVSPEPLQFANEQEVTYVQEQETVADAILNAQWPENAKRGPLLSPKHEVVKFVPSEVFVDPRQQVSVDVVTCSGVDDFYLFPTNQSKDRAHLIRFCNESVLRQLVPLPSSLCIEGRPCAAWDNWLNKYVRCEITKTNGSKCVLLAVDFGHSFEIDSECVFELPEELCEKQMMAIPCKLQLPHNRDKSKLQFDDATLKSFKDELEECDAVFLGKEKGTEKYLVSMMNKKSANNMIEWLRNQNLLPQEEVENITPKEEPNNHNLDTQSKQMKVRKRSDPKPIGPPKNLFQNAIKDLSPQRARFSPKTLGSRYVAANDETSLDDVQGANSWKSGSAMFVNSGVGRDFAVKKLAQVEQLDEWQPSKTAVGAEIQVELCDVESPAKFKLSVADGINYSEICRMLRSLRERPSQLKTVECGICCLFCDGNDRERVTITAVHSDGSVDVFCVDTGRTKQNVPRHKLCLNSSRRVRNAPCLSFSARLDAPQNTVWSEKARQVLLQTAACDRVKLYAKIQHIESTGVRSVRLRSDAGDLTQLVMRANKAN